MDNKFIAEFEFVGEKTRVLAGCPWLLDGNLVSVADFDGITPPAAMNFDFESFWVRMYNLPLACMGKETAWKIGSLVGVVEEVDVGKGEAGWGEYLQVKIRMNLSQPLARGRMLHLHSGSSWVGFKYEKLPKFCFHCGVIRHGTLGCTQGGGSKGPESNISTPYGHWLRVSFPYRQGVIGVGCPGLKFLGIYGEGAQYNDESSSASGKATTSNLAATHSGGGARGSTHPIPTKARVPSMVTDSQPLKAGNNYGELNVKKRKETSNYLGVKARAGIAAGKKVWKVCNENGSFEEDGRESRVEPITADSPNKFKGKSTCTQVPEAAEAGERTKKFLGR